MTGRRGKRLLALHETVEPLHERIDRTRDRLQFVPRELGADAYVPLAGVDLRESIGKRIDGLDQPSGDRRGGEAGDRHDRHDAERKHDDRDDFLRRMRADVECDVEASEIAVADQHVEQASLRAHPVHGARLEHCNVPWELREIRRAIDAQPRRTQRFGPAVDAHALLEMRELL